MKLIEIKDVLGSGWTQHINYKKRLVVLTWSGSVDLMVAMTFDKEWWGFKIAHEVPKQPLNVIADYQNEYEGYYYGLYLLFAGQRPLRNWLQSIRDNRPENLADFDEE